MRTVNLTLDESLWREARKLAAEKDVSVSALMREALRQLLRGGCTGTNVPLETEGERDQRERAELADLLASCNLVLGYQPSREKTYER
jgi:hypothetical protein